MQDRMTLREQVTEIAFAVAESITEVVSAIWKNKLKLLIGVAAIYSTRNNAQSIEKTKHIKFKPIPLPFNNERIVSSAHQGIEFSYNMTDNHHSGVICHFEEVYKGWVDQSNDTTNKKRSVASVFGGEHSLVFYSAKKPKIAPIENIGIIDVGPAAGKLYIEASSKPGLVRDASASCRYLK